MRIHVTDQFGQPLPEVAQLINDSPETFVGTGIVPLGGLVQWYALDNPNAGMTCEEAAQVLNRSERTVTDLCTRGELGAMRYPARWRILPSEVNYFLRNGGDAE